MKVKAEIAEDPVAKIALQLNKSNAYRDSFQQAKFEMQC